MAAAFDASTAINAGGLEQMGKRISYSQARKDRRQEFGKKLSQGKFAERKQASIIYKR